MPLQVGIVDAKIGPGTRIVEPVNIYGCRIGRDCLIGPFVEIQSGATVMDRTRVQSHTFICDRVTIQEDCFVGHGVMFINDKVPPSPSSEWRPTIVRSGASIGSGATILPVTIGKNAIVGAGAVVTHDVPDNAIVVGNPARVLKYRDDMT